MFFVHCEAITKLLCHKMVMNFKHFKCNTVKLFCPNTNVHTTREPFPLRNTLHLRYNKLYSQFTETKFYLIIRTYLYGEKLHDIPME